MKSPLSADVTGKILSYYYLLSFCPPERITELKQAGKSYYDDLVRSSGLSESDFKRVAAVEAAQRIAGFHSASRDPAPAIVQPLLELMPAVDSSAANAAAFQNAMSTISKLPGRAKPENRLHRQKGCRFCETPCRYGYFTLISDPDFKLLQKMMEEENAKAGEEQDPLRAAWAFCAIHLWRTLGIKQGYITPGHLGNLTYCLLMLATAKSRFALPEKQIQLFQSANQRLISGWPE